jgi:hypothetical protein
MSDFSATKSFFFSKTLPYFIFFPKSQKPIKAVIRHLPSNTPAEEIYKALVKLGFDAISVKQKTTSRRLPQKTPEKETSPCFSSPSPELRSQTISPN